MRSPTGVKPFFPRFDCRLGFSVAVFVMRCRACDALGGRVTVIKSSSHDACQPKTFLSVASAFLRSFRYSVSAWSGAARASASMKLVARWTQVAASPTFAFSANVSGAFPVERPEKGAQFVHTFSRSVL